MELEVVSLPENDGPRAEGVTALCKYGIRLREERGRASIDEQDVNDGSTSAVEHELRVVIGISLGSDTPLNGIAMFEGSFTVEQTDNGPKFTTLGAFEFDWQELDLETSVDEMFAQRADVPEGMQWRTFASVPDLGTAMADGPSEEIVLMLNEWINSLTQLSLSSMLASGVVYASGSLKPWFA